MKRCMKCGCNYDGGDGDYMDCPYCGEWGGNSRVYDNSGSTHAYSFDTSNTSGGDSGDDDGKTVFDKVFDWLSD
ncbi:MAG: hypothetical protein J5806_02910 [Lentisphaeria bacterium]|nr:hypothetical protein [Lentisphaeria bacterium]